VPAQPPRDDAEPYGWWGFGWDVPDPLSMVDLVAAGNVDARAAALLWLLIEARASIVVAADPQVHSPQRFSPRGTVAAHPIFPKVAHLPFLDGSV
jgi:hypothetical protein